MWCLRELSINRMYVRTSLYTWLGLLLIVLAEKTEGWYLWGSDQFCDFVQAASFLWFSSQHLSDEEVVLH